MIAPTQVRRTTGCAHVSARRPRMYSASPTRADTTMEVISPSSGLGAKHRDQLQGPGCERARTLSATSSLFYGASENGDAAAHSTHPPERLRRQCPSASSKMKNEPWWSIVMEFPWLWP